MKTTLKSASVLSLALLLISSLGVANAHENPSTIAPEERAARLAEVEREPIARSEKMGLLVVFHGSPSPSWTKLTDSIVAKVRQENEKEGRFHAVAGANMEMTFHGDIVDGVAELESAGCDRLIVVPAFIFPTGHVHFDVVGILGMYGSASIREDLREEGLRTVRTALPIAIGGTLSEGTLLKDYVLDQAKKTSTEPAKERLLIVAHGDQEYAGMVDRLIKPALDAVKPLGFDKTETAFIEMGQSFESRALPVLRQNAKDGKRTVVVAVYLASPGDRFISRLGKKQEGFDLLEGIDWVGNQTPLGEYEGTAKHILKLGVDASLY